eukprot:gb/GECG01000587.1/.p1 GENE.gb/GECG01000587.1/~~gb/GECG01000587.1/.p1  ORF type:complete len:927 (+),score=74.20 gb/GECG01000587.1/:1-2781(+)
MSFAVSLQNRSQEWGSDGLKAAFATRSNMVDRSFYQMLQDIVRFNKEAPKLAARTDKASDKITLEEYLEYNKYSEVFRHRYLLPMVGAVWSSTRADALKFPAKTLINFCINHSLLKLFDRPQWRTVSGGSCEYVSKLLTDEQFIRNGKIFFKEPVGKVASNHEHVAVNSTSGIEHFDDVIFACHPEQVLQILDSDNSREEADALNNFSYKTNTAYLHIDEGLMPYRREVWSAWNYMGKGAQASGDEPCCVTYWLNKLQNLDRVNTSPSLNAGEMEIVERKDTSVPKTVTKDLFLTLNPSELPKTSKLVKTMTYSHPQYTISAIKAQEQIKRLQGQRRMWFCGAYLGYGFHEDALKSGLHVASMLSGRLAPWWKGPTSQRIPFSAVVEADEGRYSEVEGLQDVHSAAVKQFFENHEGITRDSVGRIHASHFKDADDSDIPGTIQHALRQHRYEGMQRVESHLRGHFEPSEPVPRFTHMDENPDVQRLLNEKRSVTELVTKGVAFFGRLTMSNLSAPVLRFLDESIREGCVVLRLPDSRESIFGDSASQHRATVHVHRWSFFLRVCAEADLGLARAYIAGDWSCDSLVNLFRVFIFNRDSESATLDTKRLWTSWIGTLLNSASYKYFLDNTIAGSRQNIHSHYDLSNGLFESFLDHSTMTYSCAFFKERHIRGNLHLEGSLDEAQIRKLDHLIKRGKVQKKHCVLDIGFGWGSLAIRLAQRVGCAVHGITLSTEQLDWARQRIDVLNLSHLITLELFDYREFTKKHPSSYDRIFCCEMVEAVGINHMEEFMRNCDDLMAPNGLMVMEAITIPENRFAEYSKTADFINTIIFPGGALPSLEVLARTAANASSLTINGVENFCVHYAETLRRWQRNFNAVLPRIKRLGFDDHFIRMWNYYFAYCIAGFSTQTLGLLVLVFTRPNNPSLLE